MYKTPFVWPRKNSRRTYTKNIVLKFQRSLEKFDITLQTGEEDEISLRGYSEQVHIYNYHLKS